MKRYSTAQWYFAKVLARQCLRVDTNNYIPRTNARPAPAYINGKSSDHPEKPGPFTESLAKLSAMHLFELARQEGIRCDCVLAVPYSATPIGAFLAEMLNVPFIPMHKNAHGRDEHMTVGDVYVQNEGNNPEDRLPHSLTVENLISTGGSAGDALDAQWAANIYPRYLFTVVNAGTPEARQMITDSPKGYQTTFRELFDILDFIDIAYETNSIQSRADWRHVRAFFEEQVRYLAA